MNFHDLDDFTISYIETALWSSIDESDNPLDDNYGPEDLAGETVNQMIADCKDFQESQAELLKGLEPISCGHDFWLTRNHHGAGFWDGDYPKDIGQKLTDASHVYGEFYLLIGDDGLIYGY